MPEIFNQISVVIRHTSIEWGLFFLFTGVLVEYLFPPFPGDTVMLFGSFLVGIGVYPLFLTFSVLTLGSLLGSIAVYVLGYSLHSLYSSFKIQPHSFLRTKTIEQIEKSFIKWGDWLILGNRFLPAIRSFFFLTAGLLRRPPVRVILLGAISIFLWNGIIMFAGYQIGDNWTLLRKLLSAYSRWVVIVCIIIAGGWAIAFLIRRKIEKRNGW